jgi:hypothetical protein
VSMTKRVESQPVLCVRAGDESCDEPFYPLKPTGLPYPPADALRRNGGYRIDALTHWSVRHL